MNEKLDTGDTMVTNFEVTFADGVVTVQHAKGENYDTIVETFELD